MSQVRACYDFDAQPGSGELSIKENEILTVIREKIEGGWMEGRNSEGKHGLFPESYVVKIQPLTTTAISSPVQLPSVPVQELPAPPSLYDSSWENPSIAAPLPQSLPTIYPNLQNLSQTQPQNNSQILPTTRPQVFQNTSNNDTNNQYDDFYDEWTDEEDDTGVSFI